MKQGIRIFFLIVSLLSGALIYHEQITVGFGILTFYLGIPCFIISSLIAVLIPIKSKIKIVNKQLGSFIIWLISMTLVIFILFVIDKIHNLSPVLFSTKFYWEEGVDIEFRENRTFKALNHHMFGGDITYGKYKLKDSLIILEDKLKFGMENMKDTLIISQNGISFLMEKRWRINEGRMNYEYSPKTKVKIVNDTENKIDSFYITTNNEEPIRVVSVESKQKTNYKFDMKNTYFGGDYKLSFKIKDRLIQHSNILEGYPLETVESIVFKDQTADISLIFGNTITLNYQ